ncbi:erythrocyte membrane protein 1, PfEMP1 [Plasmodium sp. gorilla clade G1]|nr:erythrocyte membrane protein 1, PfEMP1 [Plasmodium sp. gorilla clade G1]
MGNAPSSSSSISSPSSMGAEIPSIKESENSPRNVLERYAEEIKIKAKDDARIYDHSLKGDLTQAKFRGAHIRNESKKKYNNSNVCDLYYRGYASLGRGWVYDRNPCHGRYKNRFDENELSECGANIRDYKSEDPGTACAPPRRRHLCDKNLEVITAENTKNSHDLLGNVLLTAKYEGQSIVNNHPQKETSDVCTALARSFADIGDIVRGKDMFKRNDKDAVQHGLRDVFKKIHEGLVKPEVQDHYKDVDGSGNYYKLREDWWTINRNKVWEAITCNAPYKSRYFMQSENNIQLFSNEYCGHYEGSPLTNLDYVPQFLRWYDEWAEEFCRKKKIKLEKVKEACRDEKSGKYCSLNGYDCTKTIWKKGTLCRGNGCTDCSFKCFPYESWIENEGKAFKEQKQKYEKEINGKHSPPHSTNNSINNKYYKDFYKELKDNYKTVNNFLALLNEGKYCKEELPGEEVINFTNADDKGTFYRSKYCQVCPDCGVKCEKGKCTDKPYDSNCKKNEGYGTPENEKPTQINVLYSGDKEGDITQKLRDFCSNPDNYEGKNYEKWECYYKDEKNNNCRMKPNDENNKDNTKLTSFHNFFDLWVKYLLRDTIKWKDKYKTCVNNTHVVDCNKNCNTNCVCFDKWVKQKEREWNSIKKLFKNETDIQDKHYFNIDSLFKGHFFLFNYEINQGEAKWNALMNVLRDKIESSKVNTDNNDLQDAIELLLDHLKEKAIICKDNNTNEACAFSKKRSKNPCGKNNNSSKIANVKQIAQYFKRQAYEEANKRSYDVHNLKGKAHEGQYIEGGDASDLIDICKITDIHSNRNTDESSEPCGGKGTGTGINTRFEIGTKWEEGKNNMRKGHEDVFMPPRRRHMCTSNLEVLKTDDDPLNGNDSTDVINLVNNSFLGEVLLSAKYEAQNIIDKYKEKNKLNEKKDLTNPNDQTTICRAIRYSFADIGDIIRGRDLWEKNDDMVKLETNLNEIFKNIKNNLPGDIKEKYKDDDKGKYTTLREDWWEANRHQVWEAMKCQISGLKDTSVDTSKDHCGYSDHTPLDDYIPQKLRWMREWAEWYCKEQKKQYEKLKKGCNGCMKKDKGATCWKNTKQCRDCKEACEEYKKKIEPWKKQWETISNIYKELYEQSNVSVINRAVDASSATNEHKDKNVIEFLFDLYLQNGGILGSNRSNTTYENLGAYLHDTGNFNDCQKQNHFCEYKGGSNSGEKNDEYAFRDKPHEHDGACDCGNTTQEQKKRQDEICNTVRNLLKDNDGIKSISGCHKKNNSNSYVPWKCDKNLVQDDGVCMPPRRIKLCINDLQQLNFKPETKEEDLRKAFINCAAKEINFLWHKYKNSNNREQKNLQNGKIPEDFKRIMYYTFADYRDILFGTDISKNSRNIRKVNENINKIFNNNNPHQKETHNSKRKEWWTKYSHDIWQGMLCALSYDTNEKRFKEEFKKELIRKNNYTNLIPSLEEFSSKPQFLRWFTEWVDQFCTEQTKQLDILQKACPNEICNKMEEDKEKCTDACTKYKTWLATWKTDYEKQRKKYADDKKKESYSTINDVTNSPHAYQYLHKQLKQFICKNGDCKCMEEKSTQPQTKSSTIDDMPASLDETPSAYKDKCKCPPPPDACNIVEKLLRGITEKNSIGNCHPKDRNRPYPGWDCQRENMNNENDGACMPPRRQKLCLHYLKQEITNKDGLRNAFIKSAAAETFLLWHKYKKDTKGTTNELDEKLKEQTIPPEFLRSMFYTFGDYRDICLDTDISAKTKYGDITKAKTIIQTIFKDDGKSDNTERKIFWDEHAKAIWDGMICALSYNTKEKTFKNNVRKTLTERYGYETVKFSDPDGPNLQTFSSRPQFLRWMTEWGEDFCKQRKMQLELLKEGCKDCTFRADGKTCDKDSEGCKQCSDACTTYQGWLETWRGHYNKQKVKFLKDKEYDADAKGSEHAYQYLGKQLTNITCTNRGTREKCEYKCMEDTSHNSSMPASLDDEPKEVEGKCKCSPPADACKIVETLLRGNTGKEKVKECNLKTIGDYPLWNCDGSKIKREEVGACMPPRRQKLCVHFLKELDVNKITKEEDLKKAFIKCAAAETFLLWHKYKTDNNDGAKLQTQLKSGEIPEQFKRQMFYTFGDYRDLCLGNDIGSDVDIVNQKINCALKKFIKTDEDKRKNWWNTIEEDVWKGMVCGLSHHISKDKERERQILTDNPQYTYFTVKFSDDNTTSLEEFAKRPQFLRWITEWGEEFCRERAVKVKELENECTGCTLSIDGSCERNGNGCEKCREECAKYKCWIKDWRTQYNDQSKKYTNNRKKEEFNSISEVKNSTHAYEYLHKQLQKFCGNGNCECMKEVSIQLLSDGSTDSMPQSLDEEPQEIKGKCDCKETTAAPLPKNPEVKPEQNSACTSVENLFENEASKFFKEACELKYGSGKYPGWKCNSSATKTADKNNECAVCIPPRRQKLYLKHLQELTNGTSEKALRIAFIECSATETFFLWNKYKEETKTPQTQNGLLGALSGGTESSPEDDPQKQLNDGNIPEEFKRQMFYTFGDYRDILFGKDVCSGNGIEKVQNNIDRFFLNVTPKSDNGKNGDKERENWWKEYGPHIWDGMLCALSYKNDKPTMDPELRRKITNNKKNVYNNVTISSVGPSTGIKLEEFASRPTFFRWLEEWGEEFCRKRKDMLKKVKDNCLKDGIEKKCSGDGENCETIRNQDYTIFSNFNCPSCGKYCRSYKKWIIRKRTEFEKQNKIYNKQKDGAQKNSRNIYDEEFVKKLERYESIESFLNNLNGPCSKNNNEEGNKIDFTNTDETFEPAKNCAPCSEFKVNCKKGVCSGAKVNTCNKTTFKVTDVITNMEEPIELDILVSDNNENVFESALEEVCRGTHIFEGIKKDQWECGYLCGLDICQPKNVNGKKDGKEYIQIRALFKRWLEIFLEDYNKIKEKLKPCMNNGNGSKCINDCTNKCNCVEKWVEQKEKEWEDIKKRYLDQYKNEDSEVYEVKYFLEQEAFYNEVQKAIKPCKDLNEFENSKECTVTTISGNADANKKDVVLCLLHKLKNKIDECKKQHETSGKPDQTCDEHLPPPDDDSEPEPEEDPDTSITSSSPDFCKIVHTSDGEKSTIDTEEPEISADPNGNKEEEEEKEEEKDKGDEEEEQEESDSDMPEKASDSDAEEDDEDASVPDASSPSRQGPKRLPREFPSTELKNAMLSSTILWSVGIGFAALSYFLLKKKPKSPVDLIRVLDIHKGDYGRPTPKSSNKYISYVSDTYKGKTYIYMEGDTSGDEDKYIGDITSSDITSSESEYEEMDINDIYPYTSPKYKTLIEVVLEPSKSDGEPLGDMVGTTIFTDEEWNELKHDFISQYVQRESMGVPQYDVSTELPMNIVGNVLDDGINEKPFITSIHDRDLYTGEEISHNIHMSTNSMDDPKYVSNNVYSGIDLINDTLSGNEHIDIYDEVLKRKENELFGTNYKKNTSNNSVPKLTNSDPIMNQLDLLHKWLDRHRDMCEKWNTKEELLDKLNEEWNKDNNSGDIPNDNKVLNTDVSIQIDMDDPKGKKEFSNMDTILDNIEDDIYYDVNDDENPSVDDIPMDHNKGEVPKKVHVGMKILNNKSNGSLEPEFPISDVWNI